MDELLIWLLLLGGGLPFLGRWVRRLGLPVGADDSALETLRRRYAAGEITREQFEEMRKVLARNSSGEEKPRQP